MEAKQAEQSGHVCSLSLFLPDVGCYALSHCLPKFFVFFPIIIAISTEEILFSGLFVFLLVSPISQKNN